MMLGNLSLEQIEARLHIVLTEKDKKELTDTWQQKAEHIRDGMWHCFDLPFIMVCGDIRTAEKMKNLFTSYDLSNAERFGISWER